MPFWSDRGTSSAAEAFGGSDKNCGAEANSR
jgi:hypothetical protein